MSEKNSVLKQTDISSKIEDALVLYYQSKFSKSLKKLLSLKKSATTHEQLLNYFIGLCYYKLEKYAAAHRFFETVIRVDVNCSEVWFKIGKCCYNQSLFGEAIDAIAKVLEIDPNYRGAHYFLGQCYMSMGIFPVAGMNFLSELNLYPDFSKVHYDLGICLYQLGQLKKSKQSFIECLKKNLYNQKSYVYLGLIGLESGDYFDSNFLP